MGNLDAASRWVVRLQRNALWLLPGAMTGYLALAGGGTAPEGVALLATLLLIVIAGGALATSRPLRGWGWRVAVVGVALGLFAAWAYASSGWSGSPGRAAIEADRALLYLSALLAFAALGWTPARARGMLAGLLAAIALACLLGVGSRLVPGLVDVDPGPRPERLAYPVTYWNAMGLLAGIGIIFAVHFSASLEERVWARCAGAALVPLLASALLLTLSRSGVWATALGLGAYLVLAHPRGLPAAALAIVPATGVALLGLDHGAVVGVTPAVVERFDLGGQPAWVLGASMAAAAGMRLAAMPLDRWLHSIPLSASSRRIVLASGMASLAVTFALAVIVAQQLGVGAQAYDRFVAGISPAEQQSTSRLTSLSNNNRLSKWHAALDEYRAAPAKGSGAGTFELVWLQRRGTDGHVLDAHSLYVETLGELGWPGLVLLVVALLGILGGLALRIRGPARAAPAALLGAGLAWAASAAGDWDWEMPVVTLWLFAAGGLALARAADRPALSRARARGAVRVVAVAGCLALAILPVRVGLSELRLKDSLAAVYDGDCETAERAARASLDKLGGHWRPWQVIGYCAILGRRWPEAQAALRAAADRDPRNWKPLYGLALAEAAAGKDPEAALSAALEHDPRGRLLRGRDRDATRATVGELRRAARRAEVPLP